MSNDFVVLSHLFVVERKTLFDFSTHGNVNNSHQNMTPFLTYSSGLVNLHYSSTAQENSQMRLFAAQRAGSAF